MQIDLLVLNYNGRALLEECLPSIVAAATRSRHACQVTVVDNDSTDDSLAWLRMHYPHVGVLHCPNDGLCSFNRALERSTAPVALLLNNDLRLAEDCIDPWVAPLTAAYESPQVGRSSQRCFLAAPLCWQRDGQTLEGFKTAIRWQWGLVQATGRFDGAQGVSHVPGKTASAGAAIAVDRALFLEIGGFDPRYLPGRIEDLDFCYRGYQAGYCAAYVPDAVVWHQGAASFGPAFGETGCLRLALRNTLLFQWRHLRHPLHLARQLVGIPARVARDALRSPLVPRTERFLFCKALVDAIIRSRAIAAARDVADSRDLVTFPALPPKDMERERSFFQEFHPSALLQVAAADETCLEIETAVTLESEACEEHRDRRHPISRWYLLPLLNRITPHLAESALRPVQLTAMGLLLTVMAILFLIAGWNCSAAGAIWLAWVCDRWDGKLARRQGTATRWGAWFDANIDELCDLGLHVGIAFAASLAAWHHLLHFVAPAQPLANVHLFSVLLPWLLLSGFLLGKYLMFYGQGQSAGIADRCGSAGAAGANLPSAPAGDLQFADDRESLARRLYHLPGNADVRLHVLVLAVACGWLVAELTLVAAYFSLRWIVSGLRTRRRLLGPLPRAGSHAAMRPNLQLGSKASRLPLSGQGRLPTPAGGAR